MTPPVAQAARGSTSRTARRKAPAAPNLLVLAAAAAIAGPAFASIEGDWLVEDGSARVRISRCDDLPERVCGRLAWVRDPVQARGTDANNPDARLRTRAIAGLQILSGFRPSTTTRWDGGKLYDPKSGKTYESRLQLRPDGALKVEGCFLRICRSQAWKRA